MQPEQLNPNPYMPDRSVDGSVSAEAARANLAAVVPSPQKGAWRAWLWPTAALLFWLGVGSFYENLQFWLFEVPNIQPPSRDSIMGGVVTISTLMWLMGCGTQVSLLARIRLVPGVRKHLVAGVLASGVGVLTVLNSWNSVKLPILEYGGNRGPIPEAVPEPTRG